MRFAALIAVLALVGCDAVPRAPDPPPEPEEPPADELEAQLRERGKEVADWMTKDGPPKRATLAQGEIRDFGHALHPGWCYKVVALADESVGDLDLRLYDSHSVLVERDTTEDVQPVLGMARPVCPNESAIYRIEVRALSGGGRVAVQVYRSL